MATIVEVTEKDLPACLEVIHQSFMTVAARFGLTNENCPTNGAFMPYNRLSDAFLKGDRMFGLYEDNRIVGFLSLSEKENGIFELEKLAVLPACRHQGYGKRLIDFAKNMVVQWGGVKLTVGIIEENRVLKEWYMQIGFRSTGTAVFQHLPFTVEFLELAL